MNTHEWCNIDNTYYGKEKVSNMIWNKEDILEGNMICISCIGTIAVLINKEHNDEYFKTEKGHNLKIYTSIGRLISSCRLSYEKLICFGWNKNGELVLLFSDNIVKVYSCFCENLFIFSLDENIKNEGILMSHICDEGIIIITEKLNIYVNYYFSGSNCIKYPSVDLKGKPHSIITVEEDKLGDDLIIYPNYFESKGQNDLLKLNLKSYIINPFEKKNNHNQKWDQYKNEKCESETYSLIKTNEIFHESTKRNKKKKDKNNKEKTNYKTKWNGYTSSNSEEIKKRKHRILMKTATYELNATQLTNRNYENNFSTKKKVKKKTHRSRIKNDLNIHILIALNNGGLILINKHNFKCYDLDSAPYLKMALSKSGNMLACLSTNGTIKIYLVKNLNRYIDETILDNKKKIQQLEWCGDDCLAVYVPMITPSNETQHVLFMGGPKNQWIPYQYKTTIYLKGDTYGIKIWCKDYFEYSSRIRKSAFNIFSIGSCTPSAILFYCYEKFKNGNMCIEDEIRAFHNDLNTAIDECLDAAMYEYNDETVHLLLQTCLFGKRFLKTWINCKHFLLSCLYLRIAINVKKPPLDIFISAAELKYMSIPNFVTYLAKRKEYLWAYRICKYAGISTHNILIDWCKEKIEKSIELTDEQLCAALIEKVKNERNIDYSYIAFIAAKNLRPQLATIIIQYEENTKKQIEMLLKLANYNLALEKAILSKDMELVYFCIINILNPEKLDSDGEKDLTILKMTLKNNPIASRCFYVYCLRTKQYKLLKRFYEKTDQHHLASFVTLDLALSKDNYEQKKTWLAYSAGFLTTKKMTPHMKFVHSSIMNHIDLLNNQKELEIKYNKKLVIGYPHKIQGLSLMKTIEYIISIGEFIDADNMCKKFKLPETKYWMCKVHALAKNKYFDELFNFANYRTSPIGLDYFIECAYEFGSIPLTIKLIYKLKDLNSQYKWFVKLKIQEEAEKVLQQMKSQKLTSTIFQTISNAISNIR